ncbi:MAG: hypothetical protein ACHQYP_06755 [Nitrospiria bacterium]
MRNRILILFAGIFLITITSSVTGQSDALKSETDLSDSNEDGNESNGSHDPFHLPKKRILSHQMPGGIQVGQWHLTGILVGVSGERLAILNDRLVSEGDKVLGGQIDRIYPNSVIIKGPFGTRELKMLSFSSEGQTE